MLRRWAATVIVAIGGLGGAALACVGDDPLNAGDAASDSGVDATTPSVDGASESGGSDSGADATPLPDADVGPCNGTPYCARYVFRTSAPHTGGTIGGYAQADVHCQEAADGVDSLVKGRTWRAWLSTSAPDGGAVAQRLVHGSGPYRLVDGTVVAHDWADLVDGTLDAPISLTEKGDPVGAGTRTWTGTTPSGAASALTCTDWTNNSGTLFGTVGLADATNKAWTSDVDGLSCAGSAGLYCIEH